MSVDRVIREIYETERNKEEERVILHNYIDTHSCGRGTAILLFGSLSSAPHRTSQHFDSSTRAAEMRESVFFIYKDLASDVTAT